MEYRFANQIVHLNPSAIREILKYSADPEVVSLSAGNPAPDAFPVEAIREISSRVLAQLVASLIIVLPSCIFSQKP